MVTAALPLHVTDDKGEWMGDFQNMTQDRDRFDIASGYTARRGPTPANTTRPPPKKGCFMVARTSRPFSSNRLSYR